MDTLARFKDLIAIAVATVAVVLSLITVIIQRRQQQRNAYREIQDVLMSEDIQRGRWMVIAVGLGHLPFPERYSADFYLLNRTLGIYDTLAMYVRRRVVPRTWVLDMWHHPLRRMQPGAEKLAQRHRELDLTWTPWPELWPLIEQAENYRTSLRCCTETGKSETEDPASAEPLSATDDARRRV